MDAKDELPIMPAPPAERLTPSRTFQHIGIDYLEPILVTNQQIIQEKWICLFTCLVTRAAHLECVNSLSANDFNCILQRFLTIKGKPETITSDNTTQFVAAIKTSSITWHFIAAHAH